MPPVPVIFAREPTVIDAVDDFTSTETGSDRIESSPGHSGPAPPNSGSMTYLSTSLAAPSTSARLRSSTWATRKTASASSTAPSPMAIDTERSETNTGRRFSRKASPMSRARNEM